jgi:hypothetical protein
MAMLIWSCFYYFSAQKILKDEKELATRQQEVLDGNCKKYDMLETLVQKGDITNLAQQYGVNLNDWWVIRVFSPLPLGAMAELVWWWWNRIACHSFGPVAGPSLWCKDYPNLGLGFSAFFGSPKNLN